jgi:hypothetical protein
LLADLFSYIYYAVGRKESGEHAELRKRLEERKAAAVSRGSQQQRLVASAGDNVISPTAEDAKISSPANPRVLPKLSESTPNSPVLKGIPESREKLSGSQTANRPQTQTTPQSPPNPRESVSGPLSPLFFLFVFYFFGTSAFPIHHSFTDIRYVLARH